MQRDTWPDPPESRQQAGFEEIEHTADWALRIYSRDLRGLLINAARGMNSLLIDRTEAVPLDREETFELDGLDPESLLVSWLSELAYWAEQEQVIFREFDLPEVSPTWLRAVVRGGRAPDLKKHIKAVTYHNLAIIESEGGLTATVVFDV
ncbi:MAG TPA: archease [Anaerolineae bacterium]|jgi:SHS2 domain-containing protein